MKVTREWCPKFTKITNIKTTNVIKSKGLKVFYIDKIKQTI